MNNEMSFRLMAAGDSSTVPGSCLTPAASTFTHYTGGWTWKKEMCDMSDSLLLSCSVHHTTPHIFVTLTLHPKSIQ